MHTYRVYVRRILEGAFAVEAESQAEAEQLAEQRLDAELPNMTWDADFDEIEDVDEEGPIH
jgi:hypothetical protein